MDWDCDGSIERDSTAEVNKDGQLTEFNGQNNWKSLVWDGGAIGSGAEAPSTAPGPELDFETYRELQRAFQR